MIDDSPIRRLRAHLRLSQVDFGKLIGRSHQTVANYEKGLEVPDDVTENFKTIAAEHGLADLAVEFSSDEWRVRTLIHPPADFARRQTRSSAAAPPALNVDRQATHALLDALLDSGNEDAILAVRHMLRYFAATIPAQSAPAAKVAGQRHAKP